MDTPQTFCKKITPNDLGLTGSHQSGWHVPKEAAISGIFPRLSQNTYNPEVTLDVQVVGVGLRRLRYIWYNNLFHASKRAGRTSRGRNEYRIVTHPSGTSPRQLSLDLSLRVGDVLVWTLQDQVVHLNIDRSATDAFRNELVPEPTSEQMSLFTERLSADAKKEFGSLGTGWIYILSNPAMPSMCKIGFAENSVDERVKSLSRSSGIPVPFKKEKEYQVKFPQKLESLIHELWSMRRVNDKREFFQCEIGEAISFLDSIVPKWRLLFSS